MGDLRLSLEHMTVLGMSPLEIIETAEGMQVELISLILDSGSFPLPLKSFLADGALTAATAQRLNGSPVRVHAAEGLVLEERMDFSRAQRLCEIAATLGAQRVVTLGNDPDRARTIENMARLCEIGATFGLQVSLEFVAPTCVARLEDAIEVIEASGAPNAAISIDLLHLIRSGGSLADMRERPLRIGATQLCDGPLELPREQWWDEALRGRLAPGEGEFPIRQFIDALPAATIVGLEVPKGLEWPGAELIPAARHAVEAARALSPRLGNRL